jgi:hypothetical protein
MHQQDLQLGSTLARDFLLQERDFVLFHVLSSVKECHQYGFTMSLGSHQNDALQRE